MMSFTSLNQGHQVKAGKLKNKIYKYDENFFEEIVTSNQAYILGYITGDGTIIDRGKSKRLVLSLAEEDKQLIYDIAKEFNMQNCVKFRRKIKTMSKISIL
jgi:hypothetical protein